MEKHWLLPQHVALELLQLIEEHVLGNLTNARVQLQFVEHSNRRKMKSYSMRRKNSISAIIFI